MSNISTFGAFTTARLGIFAAQRALDITGHNITNINTIGYTRQRLDQMSFRTGGADRYASEYSVNIGSGVLCTGVSQLRDPYLDIRFRNEQASVGAMDTKLSGLEDLSKILDEVGKGSDEGGVLQAQFNDLIKQLGALTDKVGQEEYDTLVRSSADVLVKLLNSYASDLEDVRDQQDTAFRQDLDTVNALLKNIGALNDTIQKSELHGDGALELRDQRNLMLDQLSKFMKVDVEYQSVSVGAGASVEKMVIRTSGNPKYTLVDGNYVSQVSIGKIPKPNPDTTGPGDMYIKPDGTFTGDPDEAEQVDCPKYPLEFAPLTNSQGLIWGEKRVTEKGFGADRTAAEDALALLTNSVVDKNGVRHTTDYSLEERTDKDGNKSYFIITQERRSSIVAEPGDTVLYGSLQASREMLTEQGEFTSQDTVDNVDPSAATKRGIPYYQKSLDALAQKLAGVLNGANTGHLQDKAGNFLKGDGSPVTYVDGAGVTKNLTKAALEADPTLMTILQRDGVAVGGALFSNGSGDDTRGITASNISISKSWSIKDVKIVNSFVVGTETGGKPSSTDTSNILHLVSLMDSEQQYKASDVAGNDVVGGENAVFFKGSFQKMLVNMSAVLANDVKTTTTLLNNYASSATELDISRSSVSGVDLNDEAASLMQYQKSYAAACRLMTTLDEALDKLINGTGVVGR